jgi:carboxymethylenebutenolidase
MIEQHVDINAKDGVIETFVCHPQKKGPWPSIIFYMDAPGIREELHDMARRMASVGYFVVLPNLYYRQGRGVTLPPECTVEGSDAFKRMFELMFTLSNELIMQDTAVMLDFLKSQPAADAGRVGAVGYCMSGQFALHAAARYPDQIRAAGSYHGVALATDQPDSPHLLADKIRAEVYLGFGEVDPLTPPEQVETVRNAFEKAEAKFELEVYPGAGHGFVFPGRAHYVKAAAERHWETLFDLFGRNLKG